MDVSTISDMSQIFIGILFLIAVKRKLSWQVGHVVASEFTFRGFTSLLSLVAALSWLTWLLKVHSPPPPPQHLAWLLLSGISMSSMFFMVFSTFRGAS